MSMNERPDFVVNNGSNEVSRISTTTDTGEEGSENYVSGQQEIEETTPRVIRSFT